MTQIKLNSEKPVAIVTGASGGIGFVTASLLAESGYQVVSCDLESLSESDNRPANWVDHLQIDVRSVDSLSQMVESAAQFGTIRALVNNAGIVMVKDVAQVTEEDWDNCLDINLKAAFFATKLVLPYMKQAGGGAIVNLSSNAGLLPRAHDPVYSTSKMAMVGMTRSLALSLSGDNIRVNAVCPGPVSDTGQVNSELDRWEDRQAAIERVIQASPLAQVQGRMVTREEVAQSILYLLSDAAMMITGTAVAIDGGKSLGVPPASAWTSS